MIWNQKEVLVSSSLRRFNEVRDILSAKGIKYKYRVVDNTSTSLFGSSRRAKTGSFGESMDYSKMYYIYVYKDDYENIYDLLRK
ncbi:hypothetical protein [Clostridium sp.]|uniref:hypothetical protein n=1 Tax=Clostridium sp. TaxID=1506 RepID=UPI001DF10762|nr:hypothetical protein [Clostridium sp.]MBS5939031.1 hypothetical protein [Clostridium sp.]